MQLNLFEWDIVAIGSGYTSLARLDFNEARNWFTRVFQSIPDHPRAHQGMREVQFWQDAFAVMRQQTEEEFALRLGWESLCRFKFDRSENHLMLRRNILRHLLTIISGHPDFYDPPHLCSGYLLLQLGEFTTAEQLLRLLLETQPNAGLVHLFLAEALQHQKKRNLPAFPMPKRFFSNPSNPSGRISATQPWCTFAKNEAPPSLRYTDLSGVSFPWWM
jgi:hypothetical protein